MDTLGLVCLCPALVCLLMNTELIYIHSQGETAAERPS
jgi:hypothetical protein